MPERSSSADVTDLARILPQLEAKRSRRSCCDTVQFDRAYVIGSRIIRERQGPVSGQNPLHRNPDAIVDLGMVGGGVAEVYTVCSFCERASGRATQAPRYRPAVRYHRRFWRQFHDLILGPALGDDVSPT